MHCNNPWMWFSSLSFRCAVWFNKCRALDAKGVPKNKIIKTIPWNTTNSAVCAYGQYIQWLPTEHYIISRASLHWREQQIALEQSPNASCNTQALCQGLHLVPIVFSLCHVLKHHPGCTAKPEYLRAWETARVRSETFHLGPLSRENSRRGTEWNEFSRLKKKRGVGGVRYIWWVSRGLFATCVKRPSQAQ